MQKFFLYARKSTDVEDKQVLSIEAQITELREFAKREGLNIIEELIEKQSAKVPGRTIFDHMLRRIEHGEASGIVSWHPDRLARNSVDGGKVIYLLDTGKITALKFPQFWFEPTPQGKFMLNIAFGQSKYYVDSLSENTKRGLRQKVRNGEFPGIAPIGYINDLRSKLIVVDRVRSKVVQEMFELYSRGDQRLEDISHFLAQHGILSKNGKRIHRDRISFILSNPLYYGHFRYGGEVHEGRHQPIISKEIFDTVQAVLRRRTKVHTKPQNEPKPFCGLLRCAECQMMITAQVQKGHTYYHCTKKSKTMKCTQPYTRQEDLDRQLSQFIQKFSLKEDWATKMFKWLKDDEKEIAQSSGAFIQESREKIIAISLKLRRLLDSFLEQDIEREVYVQKKSQLMSEKKSLEEKVSTLEQKQIGWLEPMRKWINEALEAPKIARDPSLAAKKVQLLKVFGLNLVLDRKKARGTAVGVWCNLENTVQCRGVELHLGRSSNWIFTTPQLTISSTGMVIFERSDFYESSRK